MAEVWSPGLVWWFALLGRMPKMASETLMVAPKFVFLGPIIPLSGQPLWVPEGSPSFIGGRTQRPHRFTLDVIQAAKPTARQLVPDWTHVLKEGPCRPRFHSPIRASIH